MQETVVASADLIPDEVPGARWVALEEGGRFPAGYYRVVYRIEGGSVMFQSMGQCWLVPYAGFVNLPRSMILVVAPMPSQRWWERYYEWVSSKR